VVLKNNGKELVSLQLTGPDLVNVGLGELGTFALTVKVASDVVELADGKGKKIVPFVELSTLLPIKGDVKIEIVAKITDTSSIVRFDARLDKVLNVGIKALAEALGKIDIDAVLPEDFKLEDHVQLSKLYIDFNIKEKKIVLAAFKMASTKLWEITKVNDNAFNASELVLQFGVDHPFNKEKRVTSLKIEGEVNLDQKSSLTISAAYPGFKVKGALKKNSELKIKDFIKQFVGPSADVPELITIDTLDFSRSAKDYSFNASLKGDWTVGPENTELSVSKLTFKLDYKGEQKVRTANFLGVLKVDTVDLKVTTNYSNSGDQKGWAFTTETGAGQQLPMGKFISYLAKNFKAGDPPAWVKSINLQDLKTSFNTGTKEFAFSVNGGITVGNDKILAIALNFALTNKAGNYQKTLAGEVKIDASTFKLKFSRGDEENRLAASWSIEEESGRLQIEDIVSTFGLGSLPEIPAGFNLALKKADFRYDFDVKAFVFTAVSDNYGRATFVAKKLEQWVYAFGLNMDADVKLKDLPLIGNDLASIAGEDVGLKGIKLIGISAAIAVDEIKAFNELIEVDEEETYPTLPESDKALAKATYAVIQLDLGADNTYDYKLNTAKEQIMHLIGANDADENGIIWRNLQKNIGPVHFNRVGIGYKDKRVTLLLDAALVFSVLKIEMLGLGASNPIDKVDPAFELSGVNVSYKNGPVEIAGSFLKTKNDKATEYSGTAVIALQNFRLSALGSYASVDGNPSLFIFAMLNSPPPGGPPCFFVTGIAAGFGYNRGLRLPAIDEVAEFPLVKAFVPGKGKPFSGSDPNAALKVLIDKKLVPIQIGQNWLAAGVQFSSFQLVQSYALMSVQFGTTFEIGILGTSEVSIPPSVKGKPIETPLAFARLALNARILPDTGVVSIEAKLTPESYILSKKCVLTGGFAFYLWTAPSEHEGDFVVTLGGYHPDFKIPTHYPKVPRLGFNWQVSNEILVKGAMYFAITPTCLMAGGLLEATYISGNLKAWFIMGADFLIAWKPYFYSARMYVSFGVQYTFNVNLLFTTITETISVCIGADLKVWGPDFSGIASIHLWIISFDVSFGAAENNKQAAITWEEFKKSFLPPSEKTARLLLANGDAVEETQTYCYSKLTDGLQKEMKPEDKSPLSWIVSRDRTAFESYTICPAKEYEIKVLDIKGKEIEYIITNQAELEDRNINFGVGMVNVENKDFYSKHQLTIQLEYEVEEKTRKYEVTAILRNVPKSLWEKRPAGYGVQATVDNVLVGFQIRPQALAPKVTRPVALADLQYENRPYDYDVQFANPKLLNEPAQPTDGIKVLKDTINAVGVAKTRAAILKALKSRGRKVNPEVTVSQLAGKAQEVLLAPPVIKYSYWKKSA
jgi:hypothetical protein